MKKVYIAGAMSADNILQMLQNIHDGIKLGAEVLKLGYAPFVPHLDIAFRIQNGSEFDVPLETYYNYTMEWLKASDIILVCPNYKNSKGTLAEIEKARELKKPIYYSLEDLKRAETLEYSTPIVRRTVRIPVEDVMSDGRLMVAVEEKPMYVHSITNPMNVNNDTVLVIKLLDKYEKLHFNTIVDLSGLSMHEVIQKIIPALIRTGLYDFDKGIVRKKWQK